MNDPKYDALRRLAGDVPRETYDRLVLFEKRFGEWNRRINLTSESDRQHLWQRHILDSAQLLRLAPTDPVWLDIGSGGGFPGAVAAIMLKDSGEGIVHLVESNRKKAAFLTKVMAETGARACVHACRIESLHGRLDGIDVVSARAVAELSRLLNLARPWIEAGAKGLFQKGRDYQREIEDCRDGWTFDLVRHASRVDPGGVILEIGNLRKKLC